MSRYYFRTPGWPIVLMVGCLFVLSLFAPSAWRTVRDSWQKEMLVAVPPVAENDEEDPLDRLQWELAALASPPQLAPVAPPVAERIVLDPSIMENPPLPPSLPMPLTERPELQEPNDLPPSDDVEKPQRLLAQESEPIPTTPAWALPVALLHSLEALKQLPEVNTWAVEVESCFERMAKLDSISDPESMTIMSELKKLTVAADQMSASLDDVNRPLLLRSSYGITRRVNLWSSIHELSTQESQPAAESLKHEDLQRILQLVEQRLRGIQQTEQWREYLMLDAARSVTQSPTGMNADEFRRIARRILARMDDPGLSIKQAEFFEQKPFCDLSAELRRWAGEPVDYQSLLVDLERYELDFDSQVARRIAHNYQILRWSRDAGVVRVAELLNAFYRNANVRVALSGQLINRLLPPPQQTNEESYDNILDADVHSYSQATTSLNVSLIPDRRRWQIGLEANGQVYSDSESRKGIAAFFNQAFGRFQARKHLVVDRRGVRVGQAEADASSEASLQGLETDFDGVPLLGSLVRSIAKQQYHEQSGNARREIEGRMASRASGRFDQEVHQRLERAEREFKTKILKPLQELDLKPTAVDMETTDLRLIVRERLAGELQLGAHTPRPQAPGNSLLSLQIHESAMNNALEHLNLEGRKTDLRSLYRELADRFDRKGVPIPEDVPDDVVVQFADHNAVRIRCSEKRITLTIQLAELSHGRSDKWKNFAVQAHYQPTANQNEANLIRDGVIELAGERLSIRDQVALRGIFSRILSRNRTVSVVNKKLRENPQLAHLAVGQFVVQDGWIGIAMVGDDQFSPALPQVSQPQRPGILRR